MKSQMYGEKNVCNKNPVNKLNVIRVLMNIVIAMSVNQLNRVSKKAKIN